MFDFDEVNGLSWREKRLQQEESKRRVEDALLKSIYV